MSPRTKEQLDDIREGKRALILNTALELFAEEGYYSTSISKISKEAGISKGLIYNYFESKEEIIKTIMFDGLADLNKDFDLNNDGILTKEELRNYIEKTFDKLKENLHFWKLYFSVIMQPPVLKLLNDGASQTSAAMVKMLYSYFQKQGCEDPMVELCLFGSIMSGVSVKYLGAPELFPLDKIKERVINIYIK